MDEFAQSREDDDLFADEFEPVVGDDADDTSPPTKSPLPERSEDVIDRNNLKGTTSNPRGGRREGGSGPDRRQRGGRGGVSNGGLNQSRYASAPSAESNTPKAAPAASTEQSPVSPKPPITSDPVTPTTNPVPTEQTSNARTPAVRGDRSATGGPAHKKLTEEELTAKLERMAILNAQKAERHRLSEADQAAFHHREKELENERREKAIAEKKNERLMEMERAKNRERKMKAQGGREWDSEKVESDIVDGRGRGRSSEYVRGGHGGVIRGKVAGLAGSRYSTPADDADVPNSLQQGKRGAFEIRGRGGRAGRGGRGGKSATPTIPTTEDFPSLPTPPKATSASTGIAVTEKTKSLDKAAGDWAEEMATPVEEKKMAL